MSDGSMKATATGWEVTVPPGRYFLGDPNYAVPQEEWPTVLQSSQFFEHSPVGTTSEGQEVLGFQAAYGDGEYVDQKGQSYSVESRLIGLTPEAAWKDDIEDDLVELGRIVEFEARVKATRDTKGVMKFDIYVIDTDGGEVE